MSILSSKPSRPLALAESLFVALIWASSFIVAKFAVTESSTLMMAGMRYTFSGLILLPFLFHRANSILRLPRRVWGQLIVIGISAHILGNGVTYLALDYLSPTTLSFLSSFIPLYALLLGIWQLGEFPTGLQGLGFVVCLAGGALFFSPGLTNSAWFWVLVASVGCVGYAQSTIFLRGLIRQQFAPALALTALPLLLGGTPLLGLALWNQGWPSMSITGWGAILTLMLFNTVLAYLLYNHALLTLTAFESSIFLNLSPLAAAVMAWLLWGERLSWLQITGVLVVILGVTLVQWRRNGAGGKGQEAEESHAVLASVP